MKLAHKAIAILVLTLSLVGYANAQLVPPAQDLYLHVYQKADFCCGNDDWGIVSQHELAWVDTPGNLIVSNALTVEAWVLWEGSDFEEVQGSHGHRHGQDDAFLWPESVRPFTAIQTAGLSSCRPMLLPIRRLDQFHCR